MKKISYFLMLVLMQFQLNAQDSKKMVIGAGFTTDFLTVGLGLGGNVKFDYLVSDKFSIGVRGMMHNGTFEDYTFTEPAGGPGGPGWTSDYYQARNFNFGINASYYILNTNKIGDKKHSLHIDLGLGFVGYGMFNKITSLRAVTDPEYYTYTNYFGSNSLGLSPGLGYEFSLGKGKLFLDLVLPLELWGNEYTNYSDQVWGTFFNGGGSDQTGGYGLRNTNDRGFQYFNPLFFANIGYQFLF
jgi:hypothetical protein